MKPQLKPVFLTASLVLILLLFFVHSPVRAAATNNPIFATMDAVQQMLTTALSPIQSSLQGLSSRVTNLEATVTPIPGEIANIQATLTPIPGHIAALQTHQSQTDQTLTAIQNTQASQGSQINSLQNNLGKTIHVLDAHNQDLGLYMWDDDNLTTYILVPSLNRRVIIQDLQLPRTVLFFSSTDCTGTPYVQINPNQINDVYSLAPGDYFEATVGTRTGLNAQSRQAWNNNTLSCGSYVAGVGGVVPVAPVSLPFSEPLSTPLQYRYQ